VQGGDVPAFPKLAYFPEQARPQLVGVQHAILVGVRPPSSLFAYQGQSSDLLPPGAAVHVLADVSEDGTEALLRLADVVAPADGRGTATGAGAPDLLPPVPDARLDRENWARVVARLLPADAIVSDEAISLAAAFHTVAPRARRHDVLGLTGAAIGQGLPVALGAALAAPDRPVVALQADGSAIYTLSALWTMARERADVTVVILNNTAYAILGVELTRAAGPDGPAARRMTTLDDPPIDFAALARGFGVPATRATTTDELATQFAAALDVPGPHLIDAVIATAG
jgi:acetolactate synthase-1/2/3 large subunit